MLVLCSMLLLSNYAGMHVCSYACTYVTIHISAYLGGHITKAKSEGAYVRRTTYLIQSY